jgi:hypothetical protein
MKENPMEANNNTNILKSLIAGISTFSKICAGFTVTTILVMFFELDLASLLTPFIEPLLLIFLFLVFIGLAIASLIYVVKRFDANPLDAFLPFSLNALTAVTVIFFFLPLQDLRIDIDFKMNSSKYQQVVQWVNKSIENGDINLEVNRLDVISLPEKYKNTTAFDRIIVDRHENGINIFISPWGGMFEYSPGFMYRSNDTFPPDGEIAEIECRRKIQPHWFYCS